MKSVTKKLRESITNNIMLKIPINPLPILALDAFTKWNAGKKTKVRLE